MLAGGLLVAGGAEANLVGVDFGSNPNPTPQNWTATNGSAPLTNLQNDSGTPTSVGLSFGATPSSFSAIAQPSTVPSYTYSLSDISYNIYSFGSSLTMTLSGLTPGQSYPVYVFGLRGGQSYSQTITMTGANTVSFTQAANSDQLTVNDQLGSNSSNLSAYAKTITADSNGNIQVVTGPGYFLAGLAIDVPVPTATTSAATSITTTGATLNGTVNDNGAATTVNFNYGTTVSYGSSATATQSPVASGTGSTSVSAPLTGLTCNTLYHFRVSATNSVITTNGSDTTFTTSACPVPTLSVTNSPQTYTGSAIPAVVSCQGGGVASNILYGGSSSAPSDVGTYAITANCAASTNYSAVTGASAGNFVISAATPTLSVTNSPQTYTGSAIPAVVSCLGGGSVSNVKYNNSSTVPSAVASYAITADCAASANYSAVTGASAGNFVIAAAPTPPTPFVPSPTMQTTVSVGGSVNLSISGGNGNPLVTYTAVALPQAQAAARSAAPRTGGLVCTIVGSVLTPTGGTGVCQVTAAQGAYGNYQAQTTTFNITVTAVPPPPQPVPSLSEWAQIMMMFLMILTVGWYGRRLKQR